ncbi:hypothetical protein [Pelagibacterium sp. H642]|uniref:hypothetical protein n=1 Tax=Pelagibacterium sp. H642 TaxID=1881069 RepID=UPI002814D6C1|nr:hypothetical protein [Pelagibacterium sp. H642]WMT90998.1 hypothetical protein NO934_01715 [Pelagibacterium sp. H642]
MTAPIPANDNYHRALIGDGDDLPSPIRYLPHELPGIEKQKRRLAKMEAKRGDWDGTMCPANDNIGWPLAKALLAEKNHELLLVAIRYRQIERAATSGTQLMGLSPTADLSIVHVSEAEDDGSVSFEKVRRSKSADAIATTPGRKARVISNEEGEPSAVRSSSVQRPWNGDDKLHAMIDAKSLLEKLRKAVGAFVDPLEAMVVEGETYEQVGRRFGVGNRAGAMGFARGVAHVGLLAAKGVLAGYTHIDARTPLSEETIEAMVKEWITGHRIDYRHGAAEAA